MQGLTYATTCFISLAAMLIVGVTLIGTVRDLVKYKGKSNEMGLYMRSTSFSKGLMCGIISYILLNSLFFALIVCLSVTAGIYYGSSHFYFKEGSVEKNECGQ